MRFYTFISYSKQEHRVTCAMRALYQKKELARLRIFKLNWDFFDAVAGFRTDRVGAGRLHHLVRRLALERYSVEQEGLNLTISLG